MASINKVMLIGNLGADPDIRYSASGAAVANINVATTENWTDKQTGQKQEKTEWHRVVFFNRLAEIVGQYLRKGSQVYIEGSLQTDKWQDKNTGQDRYTTKIYAREMKMLGSRADTQASSYGAAAAQPSSYGAAAAQPSYPPQQNYTAPPAYPPQQPSALPQNTQAPPPQNTQAPPPPPPSAPIPDKDFDEDVPF